MVSKVYSSLAILSVKYFYKIGVLIDGRNIIVVYIWHESLVSLQAYLI